MKTTRDFIVDGDRYRFDLGACSYAKGWAQVDTSQDAWYFGTWANPTSLKIANYAEGDVTVQECESREEFIEALRGIKTWSNEQGHGFKGIDPGFGEDMKQAFLDLGLADLLH